IGEEAKNDPTLPELHRNLQSLKETKKNINIEFAGNLANEQVFELYRTRSINLFLSVSETEGLPVSMMEAISFGIPIVATDVGGCSEIVTKDTGRLIPADFKISDVAAVISGFAQSAQNTEDFRKGVRNFWKTNFECQTNFTAFVNQIQ
ncbi:MAG: amylovoran biosynthesis AmsK, partial [Bacteroidetes bacterium]|nr:amylovoran biosynthesis AmsK [Bacteroidota bacterium]